MTSRRPIYTPIRPNWSFLVQCIRLRGVARSACEPPTIFQDRVQQRLRPGSTLIRLTGQDVLVCRQGLVEEFTLDPADRFGRVFLREIARIVGNMG